MMRRWVWLVLAMVVLALAGCASASAAPKPKPTPTPTPTSTPVAPDTTIVSWVDNDSVQPIDEDGSGSESTFVTYTITNANSAQYSLDGSAFASLAASPATLTLPADGRQHDLQVRARRTTDGAVDPTPATASMVMCPQAGCATPTPTVTPTPTPTPTTASPTPTPTTTTPAGVVPNGPSGNWTLAFQDEFNGTTLDTSKWVNQDGRTMNNVTTRASNVSVHDGNVWLQLGSSTEGALISTGVDYDPPAAPYYFLPVGSYAEARVYFPGTDGTDNIWDFPAWWASGDNWPASGEHDIAEGLGGDLTVNYHSSAGDFNQGTIPGDWNNAFHTYGVHRKASSADVYWDGVLVKSYATSDNGAPLSLILNIGKSNSRTVHTGEAGALRADYVRAWTPS